METDKLVTHEHRDGEWKRLQITPKGRALLDNGLFLELLTSHPRPYVPV